MSTTVEAIYENGVLRPSQPLDLAEGTPVEVIVIPRSPKPEPQLRKRTPAEILAEIAATATPNDQPTRDAREHDQILYGKP
jgi:predicted DNA-binding antitoxin AbrB/MazE fold protein